MGFFTTKRTSLEQMIAAILSSAMILAGQPSWAQNATEKLDHLYVFVTASSDYMSFIDIKTLRTTGSTITVWEVIVFDPPKKFGNVEEVYALSQTVFDCQARTRGATYMAGYDGDQNPIEHGFTSSLSAPQPVLPESFAEVSLKLACGKFPKEVLAYKDIKTLVAASRYALQTMRAKAAQTKTP